MVTSDYALTMARYNEWMNSRLFALCATLPESELRADRGAFFGSIYATLTYTSKVDGVTRTRTRWLLVAHLFNHQAHHRGQVTTLLAQRGLDVGSTDLPFMPGL